MKQRMKLWWWLVLVMVTRCNFASSNDWFYVTVVNSGNTNAGNIRIFGDAPDRHCVTGCGQNPGGVCGSSVLGGLNMGTSTYLFGGFSSQYPQTIYFGYNAASCQFVGEPGICMTNKGPSQFTLTGPPNQTLIGTLYIDAWNGACGHASNCVYHGQIVNNSSYAQSYGLYHNGAFSGQVMMVNANSTLQFDMTDPDCCPSCWYVQLLSDTVVNTPNPIITTNGGMIATGVTTPVHPGNETPLNNTNVNLTVSPNAGQGGTNIDYGPQYNPVNTNNSYINSNIVAGDSKIVDAINSMANLLHGDLLTNLAAELAETNGTSSGTNAVDKSGTNYQAQSNSSLTNLSNVYSNQFGAGASAGAQSSLDGMLSSVNTLGQPSGSGVEINTTIHAGSSGGTTFDFHIQPLASAMGGAFTLMHQIWTYIIILMYAGRIVVDLIAYFKIVTTAKGAALSDLEVEAAGFGGNALGVIVWGLAITAFLAAWASVLALIFSSLAGAVSWSTMFSTVTGDPTGGMDNGAKHLLLASFPLALACSMALSYLVFKLTAMKASVIFVTFARLIPGL